MKKHIHPQKNTLILPIYIYSFYISKDAGKEVSFEAVLAEVKERDDRDISREVSPMKPTEDAAIVVTGLYL
jgi:hypothetical protein